MKINFVFLTLAAIALTACGTMLNGQIIDTTNGTVMPMQIAMSYGTGKMTAYNPESGERFTGQYTGVRGASNVDLAKSKAILRGDKGTVLNVSMLIQPGLRPSGIGDATDNKGNTYQVQF